MSMTKEFLAKMGIAIDKDEVTDEEGQTLITNHIASLNADKDKNKQMIDKYSSEIAELKRKEQSHMTDEEKRNAEVQALKDLVAESQRKLTVQEKVASLVELGYDKDTAEKFANDEIDGKPTIEYQKQFKAKIEADIRAEILKQQKNPNVDKSNENAKFTKENFKKGLISMEEMNELQKTDPNLYNSIIKD